MPRRRNNSNIVLSILVAPFAIAGLGITFFAAPWVALWSGVSYLRGLYGRRKFSFLGLVALTALGLGAMYGFTGGMLTALTIATPVIFELSTYLLSNISARFMNRIQDIYYPPSTLHRRGRYRNRNFTDSDEFSDDLEDIARDFENAMEPLNTVQNRALNQIHASYRRTYNEKGIDAIFAEIRTFLIASYNKNPVKYQGNKLPLNVDATLSNKIRKLYYRHPVHTAYRFLFMHPNPLISSTSPFVRPCTLGGYSAIISDSDKVNIAHMWLAASDTKRKIPDGYTREGLKEQFANILGEIGRAHNWDRTRQNARGELEEYDDLQGDKPSCPSGISQRVVQFLMVFLNEKSSTRTLSTRIIQTKFKEEMLAEGENKEAIFNKLKKMDPKNLKKLGETLEELTVINLGDETDLKQEQKTLLASIKLSPKAINEFIGKCKTYFGATRITQTNQKLNYQGKNFDSYEKLIREMGTNCLTNFYNEIKEKIDKLTKNSPKVNKKDDRKGQPLIFSDKASRSKKLHEDRAPLQVQSKKRQRNRV